MKAAGAPAALRLPATAHAVAAVVVVGTAIALALVAADYVANYANPDGMSPLRRLFNLAQEDSLGSWLGVAQAMLAALVAWSCVLVAGASGAGRRGLVAAACFVSYLAIDDGAHIHERVGTIVAAAAEAPGGASRLVSAFPSYAWQVVFLPAFVVLGIAMSITLWRELCGSRLRWLPWATMGLWGVAVAMDFFEGLDAHSTWNPYVIIARRFDLRPFTVTHFRAEPFDALLHFSKVIEEAIEMLGMTLLLAAFTAIFLRRADGVVLRGGDTLDE